MELKKTHADPAGQPPTPVFKSDESPLSPIRVLLEIKPLEFTAELSTKEDCASCTSVFDDFEVESGVPLIDRYCDKDCGGGEHLILEKASLQRLRGGFEKLYGGGKTRDRHWSLVFK